MPPKRKLKGKAPAEPTGYDEITDAASYQEDQATRYQFGDKAQRHYEEAARLYSLALQVTEASQEEQYDARYNLGRVYYALATEIYGIPKCYEALSQAIQEYRACASYNVTDKTDDAFNLAQALQTLGEYMNEGTSSSSNMWITSSAESVWLEARHILEQVRQDQLSRLAQSSISSSGDNDSFSDVGDVQGEDAGSTSGAAAIEEQMMTPSTVIETIIAAIQADMSIAETTGELDLNDVSSLLEQARSLNGTDEYMTSEINSTKHELVKVQSRIQLEKGQPINIEDLQAVVAEQRQAISALRRPDPAGLSDLADTLLLYAEVMLTSSSVSAEPDNEAVTVIVKEAIALYEQARSILGNSFQRPSSTPAHHTAALISANWQSTANAFAMLALIARAGAPAAAAGGDFRTLISDARSSAAEALNSSEGPFKAQAPDTNGITKFARTLRSAIRNDYRTVVATRDSVLATARLFLLERLLLDSNEPYGEQGRGLQALMKATWPEANDLKQSIDDFVGGLQSDSLGRLCQKAGLSEQGEWSRFIEAA
ncbi:hypothetical protein P389DRAFT_8241 [Cystobasidium minutum MCA 4210]|uniref:uncharacterized protein n=1 Tax=Cystobasidium minutum MCA 4210 TaxID=1397322 RepID=UPI0034CD9C87|eukprot:jgi/Rhomi1/8241/CE8240_453